MVAKLQHSMASPAKRPRLGLPTDPAASGLAVMLTDVEEGSNGTLLLWGLTPAGPDGSNSKQQTVLLRCPDYQPYFFIPCPQVVDRDTQQLQEPQQQDLQHLRRAINSRWGGACVLWAPAFISSATAGQRQRHECSP